MDRAISRRAIALYLPTWQTDCIRRGSTAALPPEAPLVTVWQDGPRRLLDAVNVAAHHAGLRPGMSLTHARALVPGLVTRDATRDEDEIALRKLAAWVLARYSPVVALDRPAV